MAKGHPDYKVTVTTLGNNNKVAPFTLDIDANTVVLNSFTRVLDSDPATFYKWTNNSVSQRTSTITFDLLSIKTISNIIVFFKVTEDQGTDENRVIIDHSEDNSSFTELSNDDSPTSDQEFDKSFGNTKLRYLRIRHVTNNSSGSAVLQLHVVDIFE